MRFNPGAGMVVFLAPTPVADTVRQLLEEYEKDD
jgi:hypothetical protein